MKANAKPVDKAEAEKAADVPNTPAFTTYGVLVKFRGKLLPRFPKTYKKYVELFCGNGEMIWCHRSAEQEYMNDLDPVIIRLHKLIQGLSDERIQALKKKDWVGRKSTYMKMAQRRKAGKFPSGDLDFLHSELYTRRFGRFNDGDSLMFRFTDDGRNYADSMERRVTNARDRMKGIKISRLDYREAIKRFDGPGTFFFIDPPYPGSDEFYRLRAPETDRMIKAFKGIKGRAMLVLMGKPQHIRPFLQMGWTVTRFSWPRERHDQMSNKGGEKKGSTIGVMITNYKPTKKAMVPMEGENWPSLLVPDPEHLIKRLDAEQVAGVLATKDHSAQAGPLALVNYDQRLAQSWGVVELRKGVQFPNGQRAVEALAEKLCPTTVGTFKEVAGPVWFHPLDLVEPWVPQAVNHSQKAVWTTAYINDLPDSAFLHIHPGGEKDDDGKTVPRDLRYFPIRDTDGKLDLPHLRNAIARAPQADIPGMTDEQMQAIQDKARRLLDEHKEQAEKAEEKDLSDLEDEALVKLLHVLGQEYHRAEAEGADPEAVEELREAKWAVVAEMRRRGLPPPGWAQQKSVDVAKGLSAEQEAEYQDENKRIAELKRDPRAKQPHPFRAAKFTHPNGHPRCLKCGGEERVSGWCNDPARDAVAAKKAEGFNPLAKVRPQQAKGEYADADEALKAFATDQALQDGIAVEPLIDGPTVVAHRAVKGGGATVRVDGASDDQCKAVKAALEKLESSAVMVGKLADDKVHVTDMLYWDAEPLGQQPWHKRAAKRQAVLGREKGAIGNVVGRVVHSADALKAGVKWALSAPGSTGAVLKLASATYDQGGRDNEAVIKVAQVVNAIVYAKTEAGELQCALGPISERDAEEWDNTVELEGRLYVPVGSVGAKGIEAEPGDVVRVQVTDFETVDTPGKRAITWSTPETQERVNVKPSTVADVRSNSTHQKLRKEARVHGSVQCPIQILKAEDELRFVLGVVLEPNDGDGTAPLAPDAHKDIYSETTIREACHLYQMEHGRTGVQHQRELSSQEVRICENYIMPCDGEIAGQKVRKGTWILGARILSDQVWQQVKRGELNAWSIDGEALRTPAEE